MVQKNDIEISNYQHLLNEKISWNEKDLFLLVVNYFDLFL